MTGQTKQPLLNHKLFVYIIESPSEEDFYEGRKEGIALLEALSVFSPVIKTNYKLIPNKDFFVKAIKDFLEKALAKKEELAKEGIAIVPILHISSHGNEDGLGLTNGELITWDWIKKELAKINSQLNDTLILCISSCNGFTACKMFAEDPRKLFISFPPYFALIGSAEKPTWNQTIVGYLTFYHHLSRELAPNKAVVAMRIASGHQEFHQTTEKKKKKVLAKAQQISNHKTKK